MWSFRKIDPVSLFNNKKYITFVGAGGKTSYAEYLAARALDQGRRVAITTTTKIWAREPYALIGQREWDGHPREPFVRVGKTVEEGKLTALTAGEVEGVGKGFDLVLIEGDGSKSLPLKYPASYEPIIPCFTELTVVV